MGNEFDIEKEARDLLPWLVNMDGYTEEDIQKEIKPVVAFAHRVRNEAVDEVEANIRCVFRNMYDGENDLAKRIHVAQCAVISSLKTPEGGRDE